MSDNMDEDYVYDEASGEWLPASEVAARAAGLNPLSSCEEGFCASCAAKRIKGRDF